LIYFSHQVNLDVAFFKKNKKTKNIWRRGPKVQKKMRDQSDFRFIGHEGCTGTKQLERKKQIILPINNKGISHIEGEEIIRKKYKRN
jgi:hypothetical protein